MINLEGRLFTNKHGENYIDSDDDDDLSYGSEDKEEKESTGVFKVEDKFSGVDAGN